MDTSIDRERFRLDVDSLEAAFLYFNDDPACFAALQAREGEVYAATAARALAARLLGMSA